MARKRKKYMRNIKAVLVLSLIPQMMRPQTFVAFIHSVPISNKPYLHIDIHCILGGSEAMIPETETSNTSAKI